jgi:hypothetical protein
MSSSLTVVAIVAIVSLAVVSLAITIAIAVVTMTISVTVVALNLAKVEAPLWSVSMGVGRGRESVLLHHLTQGEAIVVGGGRIDKGRRQCYQGGQDEGRG